MGVATIAHSSWPYAHCAAIAFTAIAVFAIIASHSFNAAVQVWGVAFTFNGAHLMSGSDDTSVRVWRVSDGAQIDAFKADNDVRSLSSYHLWHCYEVRCAVNARTFACLIATCDTAL